MGRIVDFSRLTDDQLNILPAKIRRLHERKLYVGLQGLVIFWPLVEEIVDCNRTKKGFKEKWRLPRPVEVELVGAFQGFIPGVKRVAVRGALSVEDDARASYAGGSCSVTNVATEQEFCQAVLKCARESFSGRMDAYEAAHGGVKGDKRLYILVQEMAETDVFAIVFTRNPANYRQDQVVVQSTFGGGELLTAGTETGDLFICNRSGELIEARIVEKRQMSTPGGIVPMPEEFRIKVSLSPNQLRLLVGFALEIERVSAGLPQDCEIACRTTGDWLDCKLIQTRPITAGVHPLDIVRYAIIDETKKRLVVSSLPLQTAGINPVGVDVFSDQNIVELLTQHPSRMAFGMFTYIFAHGDAGIKLGRNQMGYDIGPELSWGFFELIAGQPRCSIIHDALTYRIKGIPLQDYFDGFVQYYLDRIHQDPKLANYPELGLYEQHPSLQFLSELYSGQKAGQYHECYQSFFVGIRQWEDSLADQCRIVRLPEMERYVDSFERSLDMGSMDALDVPELVGVIMSDLDYLRTEACVLYVQIARLGFYAHARLRRGLESESMLGILTGGLTGVPTIESSIALFDVKAGRKDRSEFMVAYGHLGFHELEIAGPRYRENPAAIDMLIERLSGDPRQELLERVQEYERAMGAIAGDLHRDVEVARQYLALREHVKFSYLKIYDAIRQRLLQIERRLYWEAGDIFFLDPLELGLLEKRRDHATELVQSRKAERRVVANIVVPKVLFTDELYLIDTIDTEALRSVQVLAGQAMSPYVAEGKAVIILDPNDPSALGRIHPGCILVTPSADPAWAPIVAAIGKGGGLITEVGGPLAHGAIVCREMKYAGVQEVPNATRIIQEGERVRVDGRDGKVYLLDRS